MTVRVSIKDFALANPMYKGASISFYTVSGGVRTTTLATIYEGLTGSSALTNPQKLDSLGKFKQPVYIEVPVIAVADGVGFAMHETGIIQPFVDGDSVSADNGNAAATLLARSSDRTQVWGTPITADRAVTLSTTGAVDGDSFHIVRKAAATGAFNLNVGTGPLKALAAGTWCVVKFDGSAWFLASYGAL